MADIARYILRNEMIRQNAAGFVATLGCDERKPVEVVVRHHKKRRTSAQNRTLWMWHAEVASELSVRTGRVWSRDEVHELIFLPRFMPHRECPLPDGTTVIKSLRTSHPSTSAEIITEAMEKYMAWAYDMGIEITVRDPVRSVA